MEKEFDVKTVEVALMCPTCNIELFIYLPYAYFTGKYYYMCEKCNHRIISDDKYPMIKHVRI